MKINHKLLLLFFLTNVFCFSSCRKEAPDTDVEKMADVHEADADGTVTLTLAQFRNAGIEFGSVAQKQISGTIKVNGVLDVPPQQLVSISVPLGGFLKNTTLLEGSRVKKGQIIATIENLDFIQIQQDYLEAKSQLELTAADYQRQQALARENVNSQKVLQQAKTNFFTWKARHGALREKLKIINLDTAEVEGGEIRSRINLYSPIDGYVTDVNVNIGKFVSPTDVIFQIVDTEHLHAELIVFEKDVRKLKIGQKVRFTLANETDERIATVYLIGREIGEDRTVQIHCHIDKEDTELLPGMYLSALVETGGAQVPALPNEAIVEHKGQKYIFTAAENEGDTATQELYHFNLVEVGTSESELGFTAITDEDNIRNSRIVVKGAYALLSKMKNREEGEEPGH
jgi:membrane fusion protein, heavy metal efflux system